MSRRLAVLIPANDEDAYIGSCLQALFASEPVPGHRVQIIVIANGCTDQTAAIAGRFTEHAAARGWNLVVLEIETAGKIVALRAGEAELGDPRMVDCVRVYLDADVIVTPPLLAEIAQVLDTTSPRFATGTVRVISPRSLLVKLYARFWRTLPYFDTGAAGFGFFAVNGRGRRRWGVFPDVIADDTFVRLNFRPHERIQVAALYRWPLVDNVVRLIRVRRRQDRGTAEIAERFPELLHNENKPSLRLWPLIRRAPFGFMVYGLVVAIARLWPGNGRGGWTRGR